MNNIDTQNYISEMMLSTLGSSRNRMGQAFGRFELVPGEEKEGSPVYRQAQSKEIPTDIDFLMYR